MKCPRRDDLGGAVFKLPEEDHWREDGTCSYCGSLAPDEFMRQAEASTELTPTDKNYKVYVGGHRKFYFPHLSVEQMKRFVDLVNAKTLRLAFPGHFYVRPFFMAQVPA